MTPNFSASQSAAGYLFQVRAALALALEGPDTQSVIIEGLDDITIQQNDKPSVLLQLKHHATQASLSNASADLWKTIRVWSTYLHDGRLSPLGTTLTLLTTASAEAQSIASMLKHGASRNVVAALGLLREVARTSRNQALESAFEAWARLLPSQQEALVNSIYIMDRSPDVIGIEDRVEQSLRLSVRTEHIHSLRERLEGWWFGKAVRALRDHDASPIHGAEVHNKVIALAEQFHPDALPIDFLDADPPQAPDPTGDPRRFVHQLREIAVGTSRIQRAIVDYYRAFEQRSRWAREELVDPEELKRYETTLVDEWHRYSDALADETPPSSLDEADQREFGKKVFRWMEIDADIRIRPNVTEAYVMRGSYHILADADPLRVWWHPLFAQRLAALLAAGAEGAP